MSSTARRTVNRSLLTLSLAVAALPLMAAKPYCDLAALYASVQACYDANGFSIATLQCIADAAAVCKPGR
jgi:hypothetical protein